MTFCTPGWINRSVAVSARFGPTTLSGPGARCAPQGVRRTPVRTLCSRPLFYGRRNFFLLRIKLRLACYFFSSIPLRRFEASLDRIPTESGLQVYRFSADSGFPAPSRCASRKPERDNYEGTGLRVSLLPATGGCPSVLGLVYAAGLYFPGREFFPQGGPSSSVGNPT